MWLGTISDRNSRSSVERAIEFRGLREVERISLFVLENLLKNRDTADGAPLPALSAGGDCCRADTAEDGAGEDERGETEKDAAEGDGCGAGTIEERLEIEDDCCNLFANELVSLLFLVVADPEGLLGGTSWVSDDLFESTPAGVRVGEGAVEALLLKNDKIPPVFFSIGTGFESCFSSGSTVFHPGGISSFGVSILFLTDNSHAARLFAVKRWDIGLLRTMGRFLDNLRLRLIAVEQCAFEN